MIPTYLTALAVAIFITIAWCKTRHSGFGWLLAGIFVFPLASKISEVLMLSVIELDYIGNQHILRLVWLIFAVLGMGSQTMAAYRFYRRWPKKVER